MAINDVYDKLKILNAAQRNSNQENNNQGNNFERQLLLMSMLNGNNGQIPVGGIILGKLLSNYLNHQNDKSTLKENLRDMTPEERRKYLETASDYDRKKAEEWFGKQETSPVASQAADKVLPPPVLGSSDDLADKAGNFTMPTIGKSLNEWGLPKRYNEVDNPFDSDYELFKRIRNPELYWR